MKQLEYKDYFVPLALDDLVSAAKDYKERGFRLAQMHPVLRQDDSISLYYTFVKDNEVVNRRVDNIVKGKTEVPSLTNFFLAIFVFENEAHDLFGVNIVGNLLDFHGNFYGFADGVEAPMTIISPEQLAAREKAAKIERAKAAKAAKAKREAAAKAAAEAASRQEAIDELAAKEAAGEIKAPVTAKVGATVPAPQNDIDPRYAGFDPETHNERSETIVAAQARLEKERQQEADASDEPTEQIPKVKAETVEATSTETAQEASADTSASQTEEATTDTAEKEGE